MTAITNAVYENMGGDKGEFLAFWLSSLHMFYILLQNMHSCHAQRCEEYISFAFDMIPGLITYHNHQYARWLPDFWAMISSLTLEQIDFFKNQFTQSLTGLPYSELRPW